MSTLELVAAIITAFSIWLGTRENIWYYPTGLVSLVLYTWVYAHARLYAEAGLQVVCMGLMLYGWYEWLYGGRQKDELKVAYTPPKAWLPIFASGIVLTAIVVTIQLRYTNNPAPYVDSGLAAFSIVAQVMTARKWIENWLFWVVINIISIALYAVRGLYPTLVLYVVLLILAIKGFIDWRKSFASAS